jgi:uncharacterized membrane protein
MMYLIALLIGVVAGLRTMTALAAVSWAAHLHALDLGGTWLAFLGRTFTVWIFTIAAVLELVTDQLPKTPSRKVPVQFSARIISGAISGAAIGVAAGSWPTGAAVGVLGAIGGTLGGAEFRRRLAEAFHKDRPAAFIEDAAAIAGGLITAVAVA